jgi:hypothetical protein
MVKVEAKAYVQPVQEPKETISDQLNKTQTKETSSVLNQTQIKEKELQPKCTQKQPIVVQHNQSVTIGSETKKPLEPSKKGECNKQPPRPTSTDNKRPSSFRSTSREPVVRRSRIGATVVATTNQTQPLNKTANSPFADLESRLRHRSVDRTPSQSMYKGLRFVPKPTNKYFPTQNTPKARTPSLPKIAQQNRSVLLPAPVLNKLQASNASVTKSASFSQHSLGGFHRNGSLKQTTATNNYPLRALNLTQDSTSKINESSSSSSMSKRVSESLSRPIPGLLHTELRALRRNEFEQQLKEKERMAVLKRRDLEMEKMRKQQEEINRLRSQLTFKSNPIKQYKPVEVKPSEKPLTEPRSPQFNASMHRQRSLISNSTSNLSSFKA